MDKNVKRGQLLTRIACIMCVLMAISKCVVYPDVIILLISIGIVFFYGSGISKMKWVMVGLFVTHFIHGISWLATSFSNNPIRVWMGIYYLIFSALAALFIWLLIYNKSIEEYWYEIDN